MRSALFPWRGQAAIRAPSGAMHSRGALRFRPASGAPEGFLLGKSCRTGEKTFLHHAASRSLAGMKQWPLLRQRSPRRRHIPAFHPVPVKGRRDGWTVSRQADFIGALFETRSVLAAARTVSMSRESAYKLRRRDGATGFAAAWDAALNKADQPPGARDAKFTDLPCGYRIEAGLVQVIVFDGRYRGFAMKADSSGLIGHLARLDRATHNAVFERESSQNFSRDFVSTAGPALCGATGQDGRPCPPVDPNPPLPRAVSSSSATSVHAARTTGASTSCATRSPRAIGKGSAP